MRGVFGVFIFTLKMSWNGMVKVMAIHIKEMMEESGMNFDGN